MTVTMPPPVLAPSILAADFSELAAECDRVAAAGADWIHVDVMDGHFVPNISIGAPVVRSLRPRTALPLDVHLMIDQPGRYLDDFLQAGADWITFHLEAVADPAPLLERIHSAGKRAGVALRPGTPVDALLPHISACDMVLVMTVEPGFGGQSFLEEPLAKIPILREAARRAGHSLHIQVDGGIDLDTVGRALEAGATSFVAGSAIFKSKDVADTVRRFKAQLAAGRESEEK